RPPAKLVANFTARTEAAIRATRSASLFRWGTPAYAKWYAKAHIVARYNWGSSQFGCLVSLWNRESHWNFQSTNRRGQVYGIPQTTVSNINEFGIGLATYMKTPELQVQIGSRYISYRYGNPCLALAHSQRHGWY
ncbi:MAG: aggregation-promoting factor C-terminal-like domain-containing protein, partial [Candidatus Nanopelagicales bacterium]